MAETSSNILKKINRASLKLLQPLSLEKTYALVVMEAKKLTKTRYGSILLYQDGGLKRVFSSFPEAHAFAPRKRGFAYQSFITRQSLIIDAKQLKNIHPVLTDYGVQSVIFIPLAYHGRSIGVLTVQSVKPKHFNQEYQNSLELFGSMATLAIKKSQSYEKTQEALQTREVFTSIAAHELRTPLTSISGYIQLLYRKFANKTSSEAEWIRSLYMENIRLTKLVQELLDTNKIQSGKFQYFFKECSIKNILQRVITNFRFLYPERTITLKATRSTCQDKIIGDTDKLIQVFSNLLDNAAKYSPQHTPITLTVQSSNPHVIVEIHDQGKGIPKEDQQKIFEGFYKGRDNFTLGFGLGLFLCKKIIDKHQGDIKIGSAKNRGTTVTVKLPQIKTHDS